MTCRPQIRFTSLASSSSGNAYIVDDGQTKILLECGLPIKKLRKLAGFGLSEIDFCLITHEHNDHCGAVDDIVESGIPVYTSSGTAEMLGNPRVNVLNPKETVTIGSYQILPFPVFHDAAEPFGYLICSPRKDSSEDEKLMFATDTVNIAYTFPKLTQIAVECNHDKSDMRSDKLEAWTKRAMKSHMDIGQLCQYLDKLDLSAVRQIYLLHMSDGHSNEQEFVSRIHERFGIPVTACAKLKEG